MFQEGWVRGSTSRLAAAVLVLGVAVPLVAATAPADAAQSNAYRWRSAVRLTAPASLAIPGMVVASRSGARLATTWEGVYAGWRVIWVATSTDGGASWRTPVQVSRSSENTEPRIVSSADGRRLAVVWQRQYDGEYHTAIQVAVSADGGRSWRRPVDLTTASSEPESPRITSSADGRRLTVAWQDDGENGAGPFTVAARTSTDAGATWDPSVTLANAAQDPAAAGSRLDLSGSSNGSALAATWWFMDSSTADSGSVQASVTTDGGGTWGAPVSLTPPGSTVTDLQVSVPGDGSPVAVAWTTWDGSGVAAQVRTSSDGGGTWTPVARISPPGRDARELVLAKAPAADRLTAVWLTRVGSEQVVQSATSTTGGTSWSGARKVASWAYDQSRPASSLVAAASDNGRRVAVSWNRRIKGTWAVQVATSLSGGRSWSGPRTLSDLSAEAFQGRIAMSGKGTRVQAMWMRYPKSGTKRVTIRVASGYHR